LSTQQRKFPGRKACLRQQIDSLLNPLAKQEMLTRAAQQTEPIVLAEIPLLFEAGWQVAR
jgi:dephospho-CoA kinase